MIASIKNEYFYNFIHLKVYELETFGLPHHYYIVMGHMTMVMLRKKCKSSDMQNCNKQGLPVNALNI